MKIAVSGGGTGGHIYPALALIREIQKRNKHVQVLYIGTANGLESKIVPKEDIPFQSIVITGFKRKFSIENVKTLWRFFRGIRDSKKILKDFQPDIVVGTGGYVSGPVVYAASKLHIPTIIHEQNSIPGLTNKFLGRYVNKIAISFQEAKEFFPAEKTVFTGNPRASEVIGRDGVKGRLSVGLSISMPTVLIVGGSRGARPINEAVVKALPELAGKPYQVLYITGEIHYEDVKKEVELVGSPNNVIIKPFVHNMPEVLAGTDLVVSRAGATTLSELTSLGIPGLLIPSPYVTNNHQEVNARSLSNQGAAQVLLEKDLTNKSLVAHIDKIMLNDKVLTEMKMQAKKMGVPDSARRFYKVISDLI